MCHNPVTYKYYSKQYSIPNQLFIKKINLITSNKLILTKTYQLLIAWLTFEPSHHVGYLQVAVIFTNKTKYEQMRVSSPKLSIVPTPPFQNNHQQFSACAKLSRQVCLFLCPCLFRSYCAPPLIRPNCSGSLECFPLTNFPIKTFLSQVFLSVGFSA